MVHTQRADRRFQYESPAHSIADKAAIAFETVHGLDHDIDLGFQLRGHSFNALIDAATPLFGLALRLRRLDHYNGDVQALYDRVYHQIAAIGEEIRQLGYDHSKVMAYRYCVCSFLDEAVMGTPWGAQSVWAARSLLSAYHNETWGGEKFFTLLARMSTEPEPYQDVLEFQYVCLCLGFKGKYMLQHDGTAELQRITEKLQRTLRGLRGEVPEHLGNAHTNIASRRYRFDRRLPWWTPWAIAGVVLVAVYATYTVQLAAVTDEVVRALDQVLTR